MVKYKVKRKEDTPLASYNHPTKYSPGIGLSEKNIVSKIPPVGINGF